MTRQPPDPIAGFRRLAFPAYELAACDQEFIKTIN